MIFLNVIWGFVKPFAQPIMDGLLILLCAACLLMSFFHVSDTKTIRQLRADNLKLVVSAAQARIDLEKDQDARKEEQGQANKSYSEQATACSARIAQAKAATTMIERVTHVYRPSQTPAGAVAPVSDPGVIDADELRVIFGQSEAVPASSSSGLPAGGNGTPDAGASGTGQRQPTKTGNAGPG